LPARNCLAAWRNDFKRVAALRDKLAEELRTVYPAVVEQLVDLFRRIAVAGFRQGLAQAGHRSFSAVSWL